MLGGPRERSGFPPPSGSFTPPLCGLVLLRRSHVVSLVIIVFLFHVRSALIPILALPIAVVASFIPMYYLGVTSNIMSLGGIALAIGVLVDASIVMVENAYRHVSEADVDSSSYDRQSQLILGAAKQVGRPIFFSLAIIIVSFIPVFLLEAQEGRMFRPLAFTKTFAMVFASLLSITLVPVLMTVFIRGRRLTRESTNPVSRFFTWLYAPILELALRWKWVALIVNFAVVPLSVPLLFDIGSEFMPPLYEGSMLYMPTAPPGLSIGEATRCSRCRTSCSRKFPEVERVFGTVGRATTSTDNSPMGMVNTIVTLKPKNAWRPGLTEEQLQREMDEALQFPGFPNVWTQPIRNRLGHAPDRHQDTCRHQDSRGGSNDSSRRSARRSNASCKGFLVREVSTRNVSARGTSPTCSRIVRRSHGMASRLSTCKTSSSRRWAGRISRGRSRDVSGIR